MFKTSKRMRWLRGFWWGLACGAAASALLGGWGAAPQPRSAAGPRTVKP